MKNYEKAVLNISKPFAVVLSIIIITTSIFSIVPVSASNFNGSAEKPYNGSYQPLPYSSDVLNNSNAGSNTLYLYMNANTAEWVGFYTLYDSEVFVGFVNTQSGGNSDVIRNATMYLFSTDSSIYVRTTNGGMYQTSGAATTINGTTFYKTTYNVQSLWQYSTNFIFQSENDIINAISSYQNINNPSGHEINYSLPPGNIAIIETDSSYTYVNLTTTMPLQSTSFASNPWPNTTQRVGYYGTLPQTLNPNTIGNVIEWERNGNTTLFNVTTSAKHNPSVVSTFKYVVITNPYYYPANDMEDRQFTNGAININMDGVVNITVKNLTATVNTQTGEVENNYNGDEWTGEIDETTNDIIWTDSNGDSNEPINGGNLSDPSITGFQSWLKGILNNIVNIFQPAHDAISTLSGAVRNFASWMYALYVWLPSPILSLLTSAISLAIVIGIIKVFI